MSFGPIAVTSIPPARAVGTDAERRFATISLAIRSLEASGFRVVSVNNESELDLLQNVYGTVTFEAAGDGGLFEGRYGPSFQAVFDACRKGRLCAVVNADIYLIKSDVVGALELNPERFIVARRADIVGDVGAYVGTYRRGIDALFFDPHRYSALLEDPQLGRLQLGAPFWDIVVPTIASFHGEVVFVKPPFLLHEMHRANWSAPDYDLLREVCADAVLSHARKHAGSTNARKFLSIVESYASHRDRVSPKRHAKAVARVMDAWLRQLEKSHTIEIAIDRNDPVLKRAVSSLGVDVDHLDLLESTPDTHEGKGRRWRHAIRLALRRRRHARHARMFDELFAEAERRYPISR